MRRAAVNVSCRWVCVCVRVSERRKRVFAGPGRLLNHFGVTPTRRKRIAPRGATRWEPTRVRRRRRDNDAAHAQRRAAFLYINTIAHTHTHTVALAPAYIKSQLEARTHTHTLVCANTRPKRRVKSIKLVEQRRARALASVFTQLIAFHLLHRVSVCVCTRHRLRLPASESHTTAHAPASVGIAGALAPRCFCV